MPSTRSVWSLRGADIVVACDVATTFLDAPALFGPQKGASPDDVAALEVRLRTLAGRLRTTSGTDVLDLAGSGAAGGLAGGARGGRCRLVPGFDVVAEAVGFARALKESTAAITGEGKVDSTTFGGARRARARGGPLASAARRGRRGAIDEGIDLGGAPARSLVEMGAGTASARRARSWRTPPSRSARS